MKNLGCCILLRHRVVETRLKSTGVIAAAVLRNLGSNENLTIEATYFLDASELGDLLPLCGAEYRTGAESRKETGEASAPEGASPGNVQSISMCFAMEHLEGEDHVIEAPEMYTYWRDYMPRLNPSWPGKLLSWEAPNPRTMTISHYNFDPHNEVPSLFAGLWSFRRILDREMFEPGFIESDVCMVNWPMIDYMEADILNCTEEERLRSIERAKQLSLSVFYWLQTEAPRPDGGKGWPGLRLRKDIMGTEDGLAKYPYIRESRRIKAEFTVCEHHVAAASRPGEILAAEFEDSIGIGYYRIDLHPSTGGDNYIDVESLPFQIPLGSLIPVEMENMLPAAKNIGTTHITNGCYRLHPVEWNIGEVAGSLVAYCLQKNQTPRSVYRDKGELRLFQEELKKKGIELEWPSDLVLEDGDPHAHARPASK
ncbi:MAG: FAD-dependent oxidoreductase [Opitutaceae bacterium]|nr:FAD-dependent oxidoreductase [Opitutaceae bacterium]